MEIAMIRVLFIGRPKGNHWLPPEENEDWPAYRGRFSNENLSKYYAEKLKAFEHDLEFTGKDLVRTEKDLEGIGEKVKDETGVLAIIVGLYPLDLLNEIVTWGVPTIIFSAPESPLSQLAWMDNFLPAKGMNHVIPVASTNFDDVGRGLRLLKAIHRLGQTKVLYQYTPVQLSEEEKEHGKKMYKLFSELTRFAADRVALDDRFIQQAKERIGIEIEKIPPERLIRAYEAADGKTAEQLAQHWIDGAQEIVEPSRQDVVESCRLYLGMKQVMKEQNAQAFTELGICMGTGPYPLPCLAFAMLNDEGLTGICQLDLCSLLTQLMIQYLADKPGFMGHLHVDTGNNLVGISHDMCTTRLKGWSEEAEPYAFLNHSGLYRSTCLNVKMEVGQQVTVALFAPFDRMYVFTGVIDSNIDPHRMCRTPVAIRVKDARALLKRCLREDYPFTPGAHRVLFYGDWVDEIEDLGQLLNFEVIHEME